MAKEGEATTRKIWMEMGSLKAKAARIHTTMNIEGMLRARIDSTNIYLNYSCVFCFVIALLHYRVRIIN